jgi:phage shock protein E
MRLSVGTVLCAILLTGCSNDQLKEDQLSTTAAPVEKQDTTGQAESPAQVENDNAASKSESDKPIVIDVRSEVEYASGHIEDALLIPHDQIADEIGKRVKDKNQKIVLYCRSGGRAGLALKTLEGLGYTQVENLGGLEDARTRLE